MNKAGKKFENVTVEAKANIYFEGKVVSHTVLTSQGDKKTIGLIYPGSYLFNTGAAERMIITAGNTWVKQKGESDWKSYPESTEFCVPAQSSFEIRVDSGVAEYICEFLS